MVDTTQPQLKTPPQEKAPVPPKPQAPRPQAAQVSTGEETVSIIPLGDIGTVTKNMFLYETKNEILIVDCGVGFPDETLPGVDLMIPDITYLKKTQKKIVGMVLTHGHEDHIGAVPFVLRDLPDFPIYGTPLTVAFIEEKLKDFRIKRKLQTVGFGDRVKLGKFDISFVRVTHSIPDASNLIIKSPIGTFYHGSDYKFDFTPVDNKPTEIHKIAKVGEEGVLCLLSDCLGTNKHGHSLPEIDIEQKFEQQFRDTPGKVFVSTYSSHISRLNQAINVAVRQGRKICFMGRSFLKSRDVGRQLGYMKYPQQIEIQPRQAARMDPSKVMILVAGSQGQVESAMTRIANNEDRDLTIQKGDTVIFSSDPIPGNEANVYALIDTISMRGAKVVHTDIDDDFHVSGHGSQNDIKLMIALTKPRFIFPIGGTYRHMIGMRALAETMGYPEQATIIPQESQEIIFTKTGYRFGRKIQAEPVFVDQMTKEEMGEYIVFDRLKISKEGMMIILAEIDPKTGQLMSRPDVILRGLSYPKVQEFTAKLEAALKQEIGRGRAEFNIRYYRKIIQRKAEDILSKERKEPLIIPVVLEV